MKLPSIRVSQLTQEQHSYLRSIAFVDCKTANYYAITKTCIITPCFDFERHNGEYYPVTTYEEFISKWEQLKLMSLL